MLIEIGAILPAHSPVVTHNCKLILIIVDKTLYKSLVMGLKFRTIFDLAVHSTRQVTNVYFKYIILKQCSYV